MPTLLDDPKYATGNGGKDYILDAFQIHLLHMLGYIYAEELVGAAIGSMAALINYLQVYDGPPKDNQKVHAEFKSLLNTMSLDVFKVNFSRVSKTSQELLGSKMEKSTPWSTGVAKDALGKSKAVGSHAAGPYSLADASHGVKDQGFRPNCAIFSALCAYEKYNKKKSNLAAYEDLSEQYLAYLGYQERVLDGVVNPKEGGFVLRKIIKLLQNNKMCLETDWPYTLAQNSYPTTMKANLVPNTAVTKFSAEEITDDDPVGPTRGFPKQVAQHLDNSKCVVVGMSTFPSSIFNTYTDNTGTFVNPVPGELAFGGHGVVIVGYENDARDGLGGGTFIFQNSWGATWGKAGYGRMSYNYLEKYADNVFVLLEAA